MKGIPKVINKEIFVNSKHLRRNKPTGSERRKISDYYEAKASKPFKKDVSMISQMSKISKILSPEEPSQATIVTGGKIISPIEFKQDTHEVSDDIYMIKNPISQHDNSITSNINKSGMFNPATILKNSCMPRNDNKRSFQQLTETKYEVFTNDIMSEATFSRPPTEHQLLVDEERTVTKNYDLKYKKSKEEETIALPPSVEENYSSDKSNGLSDNMTLGVPTSSTIQSKLIRLILLLFLNNFEIIDFR